MKRSKISKYLRRKPRKRKDSLRTIPQSNNSIIQESGDFYFYCERRKSYQPTLNGRTEDKIAAGRKRYKVEES